MLEDFNACVGKSEDDDDIWKGTKGKHGIGSCND